MSKKKGDSNLKAENEALREILKNETGHDSVESFLKSSGHATIEEYHEHVATGGKKPAPESQPE